jgi:hypothetical protein
MGNGTSKPKSEYNLLRVIREFAAKPEEFILVVLRDGKVVLDNAGEVPRYKFLPEYSHPALQPNAFTAYKRLFNRVYGKTTGNEFANVPCLPYSDESARRLILFYRLRNRPLSSKSCSLSDVEKEFDLPYDVLHEVPNIRQSSVPVEKIERMRVESMEELCDALNTKFRGQQECEFFPSDEARLWGYHNAASLESGEQIEPEFGGPDQLLRVTPSIEITATEFLRSAMVAHKSGFNEMFVANPWKVYSALDGDFSARNIKDIVLKKRAEVATEHGLTVGEPPADIGERWINMILDPWYWLRLHKGLPRHYDARLQVTTRENMILRRVLKKTHKRKRLPFWSAVRGTSTFFCEYEDHTTRHAGSRRPSPFGFNQYTPLGTFAGCQVRRSKHEKVVVEVNALFPVGSPERPHLHLYWSVEESGGTYVDSAGNLRNDHGFWTCLIEDGVEKPR